MGFRFHMLAVPHTISTPEYPACAFTQKVLKLCKMLKRRGHRVIHYGHEHSNVECDEHVSVTTDADLRAAYGDHDWRTHGAPRHATDDAAYQAFYGNAEREIGRRKQRGDFLLCMFGADHKRIADAHSDLIVCEPGIGYSGGGFAPYRVFQSYAVLHAYLGRPAVAAMSDKLWYDAVIPNAFDLADFDFSAEKDDYFLFLGRITAGKGVHVALQIVEALDARLIIAGPGALKGKLTRTERPISDYAKCVGVVGPSERRRLLARAKGLLAPSMYLEPFCGVQIEAMLSGTPVISTDWGAFAEYNPHGVTGYRCRTFEQFTWAARNIDKINPRACRDWAERNFSLERVGEMYEEYFTSVHNLFHGRGWYAERPDRDQLDWLNRYPPGLSEP